MRKKWIYVYFLMKFKIYMEKLLIKLKRNTEKDSAEVENLHGNITVKSEDKSWKLYEKLKMYVENFLTKL